MDILNRRSKWGILTTKVNIADCVAKEEFIEDVIQYVGATDTVNEHSVKTMSFF